MCKLEKLRAPHQRNSRQLPISAFDFVLRVRNGVKIIPVQLEELSQVFTGDLIQALERAYILSDVHCKALIIITPA